MFVPKLSVIIAAKDAMRSICTCAAMTAQNGRAGRSLPMRAGAEGQLKAITIRSKGALILGEERVCHV